MVKNKIKIQMFANLDEVISANAAAFEGTNVKDQFSAISTKLNELGYDVLLNNKKSAEFVPASRLSDIVSQRDNFKGQVEQLNLDLQTLKDAAKGNDDLQAKLQGLMDQNTQLMKDMERTKIEVELKLAAKDAVDANDVLVFVDMNNIKVNAKGEIVGVEAEIERIRKAKPYLFGKKQTSKGGTEQDDNDNFKGGGMNSMIRRATGRI